MNTFILIFVFLASIIIIKIVAQLPGNLKDKLVITINGKTIDVYELPYWLRFLVWLDGLFNCKWQTLCRKVEIELEKVNK